jgi:hypothetical protein
MRRLVFWIAAVGVLFVLLAGCYCWADRAIAESARGLRAILTPNGMISSPSPISRRIRSISDQLTEIALLQSRGDACSIANHSNIVNNSYIPMRLADAIAHNSMRYFLLRPDDPNHQFRFCRGRS